MAAPAPHPTFLIIGAERAATRWLRFNLDQHPDICAPPLHLDYFSDPQRMSEFGFRWYRRQFTTHRGEPFVGECSPSYMMWRNQPAAVARRIHKTLPDVRLIAIVRNPVDRLLSAVRHHVRWGRLAPGIDPFSLIAHGGPETAALDLIGASVMFSSIYPFADRFGDQMQVLFYDDIVADPAAVYRSVLDHIGASSTFEPDDLARVRFSDAHADIDVPAVDDDQRLALWQWYRLDVDAAGRVGRARSLLVVPERARRRRERGARLLVPLPADPVSRDRVPVSMTPSQQAPLPTFLIIGAERSATRWLRFNLDRHPEVFAPPVELNWFSDAEGMRTRGRRWYQLQFDAWGGEPVLGEASPSLPQAGQPSRPGRRTHPAQHPRRRDLVAILRNPVDRFESAVRMYIKRGRLPADVDAFDLVLRNDPIVAELDLLGAGLYAGSLYPFLQRFGEQRAGARPR